MTCLELSLCPLRFGMEFFQRCWENLVCPRNRNLRQPSLVPLFWELGLWTPAVVHGASWFLRLPLATEQKGFIWWRMESWECFYLSTSLVFIWRLFKCLSLESLVKPDGTKKWPMASIEAAPSLMGPRFSTLFLLSFHTFLSTSGTVIPAPPQHGDHYAIKDFGRLGVHICLAYVWSCLPSPAHAIPFSLGHCYTQDLI